MKQYDRIVIGAGASGLMYGALSEKTNGLIIERSKVAGLKLLLTGNGQCNITHDGNIKDFLSCYGDKGKHIRTLLYKANNRVLMDFMESAGISLMTRSDGKVFPKSMKASDIQKKLISLSASNGYRINLSETVTDISYDGQYTVTTDKDTYHTPVLVIACGGKSYPKTGSDGSIFGILEKLGIKVTELSPSLAPIYVHGYPFRKCSGISFKNAEVTVSESGRIICSIKDDLLLTHKGFSGPAALNISRYVKPGMTMTVNFTGCTGTEIENEIKKDYQNSKKELKTYISSKFSLPVNFTEVLLSYTGIDPQLKTSSLQGKNMSAISDALSAGLYDISGTGGFSEAMATSGGVSLDEINMKTMESEKYRNLYFIGEVTDIDGDTGGYNLQFAFSSASAANKDME